MQFKSKASLALIIPLLASLNGAPAVYSQVSMPQPSVSKAAADPSLRGPINPGSKNDNNTRLDSPENRIEEDSSNPFDRIEIEAPKLQALITISKSLDPLLLDASSSKVVSLRDTLLTAMNKNLDIRIRQYEVNSRNWSLVSSYGKFLPNINLSYRWQYLLGRPNIPFNGGADPIKFQTPFILTGAGFTYYAYRGGKILYGALQSKNNLKAARYQEKATLSDTLFSATQKYCDLVLSEALLQIRVSAVDTSIAQLELNKNLLQGGRATRLDVLQAETQLSSDRQRLIDQQINRRTAAIALAELLDQDQGVDLVPQNRLIERVRLIPENAQAGQILKVAIENRPELKQYRELWLASKKSAHIAAAPLQPSVQVFGNIYGVGETLSNSSRTKLAPISLATASGSVSTVATRQVSRQIGPLYTLGYSINWNFEGLGISDLGNIQSAKYQSRESMLELNKQLNKVTSEVRQSYLKSLSTYRKIDETRAKVASASEELRLAQMRFQYGVGKNIDVLKAQEDRTTALIENAQALIAFNVAQAQLLRDTGLISVDRLTSRAPQRID